MLRGLNKLPDYNGTVLRGVPDASSIISEYEEGRQVRDIPISSVLLKPSQAFSSLRSHASTMMGGR